MNLETWPASKLLKAKQVAEILNVSKAFVYQLMSKGELPTVKIGAAKRVIKADVDRFIQEHKLK